MLEYNKGKCADKAERSRVMVIRTQYLERLRPFYDSELVKVITGIRRCGKSTILRQVIAEIKENGIDDSHIVYINFEDYKYHKLTDADAFYEYVDQKIVDESNQPIEFANIVCLSLPDSTFIYGTISDQDGKFTIPENSSKGILRISSVGYATTYKECKDRNIGTILLHSDTQLLGEVVVKGNLPVTRMKGDALVTSVQNSVLAKAGSANDVLGKVPGILKDKDSFEVFGKGTPLIYINGREVRDKSELEQLSSEDIKHVELITNPGARYDATVNAVVRIQTIRRTGDGFGFNLNSSYYQSENVDLVEQADVNYRHNGLDMFAMFRYDKMEFRERTNVHQTLISKKQLDLENQLKYNDNKQWLRGNIGMNYMFDENNSIGIKYSIQGSPRYDSKLYTTSKVSLDGKVFDRLQNFTSSETDNELNHQLNAYYTGRVGNLEIDFNADYYQSGYLQEDITGEESEEQEDLSLIHISEPPTP